MTRAYIRRKQFEARLAAIAIVNTLGEALGGEAGEAGGNGRGRSRVGGTVKLADGRRAEVISPAAMLRELRVA